MRVKSNVGFFAMMLSIATVGAAAQAPATPPRVPRPGLTLTTTAFEDGGIVPNKFTQASEAPVSPELKWTHVPDGTVSFALILNDPDTALSRTPEVVLHWLIFNIPGTATGLPEGVPGDVKLPDGSVQGMNQSKKVGYMGMGAGAAGPYHHYTYELYALDIMLTLGPDATRADLLAAMSGHIRGKAILMGRFHKP
jgi:Raf kinase inhibitor-like YbhB/YbcL family protein